MSKEIKCPNCGEKFKIDESQYLEIVQQIKTIEFNNEINEKMETERKEHEMVLNNLKLSLENKYKEKISKLEQEKNNEIIRLAGDLKHKEEELAQAKDYKIRLTTKGVGEDLEQYCATEFEKLRSTAFPNAYFEKDNTPSKQTKSKGDFIFRDYDLNDNEKVEYVSIMFEMKNENEETSKKHKNEDFLKELDKDRNEKGCEYAVLVSMLEADSDLYNTGIVDMSHKYPKMYVVRPQFFIQIISLIRNAAKNTLGYKRELVKYENEHIDIKALNEYLNGLKEEFNDKVTRSHNKFEDAIKAIDDSIEKLKKVKEGLTKSGEYLTKANNLLVDLELTKVAKNNPTLKEMMIEQGVATEEDFKRKNKKNTNNKEI